MVVFCKDCQYSQKHYNVYTNQYEYECTYIQQENQQTRRSMKEFVETINSNHPVLQFTELNKWLKSGHYKITNIHNELVKDGMQKIVKTKVVFEYLKGREE